MNSFVRGGVLGQAIWLVAVLLGTAVSAVAQPAEDRSFAPSTAPVFAVDYPSPTADKPQSKLWYMDGCWWAVLPRAGGPSLWQRRGGGWVEHEAVGQALQGIPGRADVWPVADGVVAVAVADATKTNHAMTVFRLTRQGDGADGRWEGRVLAELRPPATDDLIETATILQDSSGAWWVAAVAGVRVCVWTSSAEATAWSDPIVLGEGVAPDDICVVTPLPQHTIGVIWSDQVREGFLMRAHSDGAVADAWRDEAVIQLGGRAADDHLNTVIVPDGTLWVASKNEIDTVGEPQFTLHERDPRGAWRSWPYAVLQPSSQPSRPIVVSSADGGMVLTGYGVTHRAPAVPMGSEVVFSRVDSADPERVGAPRTVIAPDPALNSRIQNVTGPRHFFPPDGPWIVLASDPAGRVYEADLRAAFSP